MGPIKMASHLFATQFLPFIMSGTPYSNNPNSYRDDEGFKRLLKQRAASLSDGQVDKFRGAIAEFVAKH
jgi:hypothetical protein